MPASRCSTTSKKLLSARGKATNVGDEGGFAPSLESPTRRSSSCSRRSARPATSPASRSSSRSTSRRASCSTRRPARYDFEGKPRKAAELVDIYAGWTAKYPLVSIEDGLAEDDWDGWRLMTQKLGEKMQIVGDDIFVTQTSGSSRASRPASRTRSWSSSTRSARSPRRSTRCGPRSTPATPRSSRIARARPRTRFIADLAVATNAGQIKTGSASRSDRIAKYNQLLRIGDQLGDEARFAGAAAFARR